MVAEDMMSFAAAHESKLARRACQLCQGRKARFRIHGAVRADRDHVLCFECYRAERNRRRAQRLAEIDTLPFLRPSGAKPALSPSAVAHRQRMLSHLGAGAGQRASGAS
jgi:hypothetical protein